MKFSCSYVESLLLVSRVGSEMSMAQKFLFSRMMFGWPVGHGSGLSEGSDGCSFSQESSSEMNGEINFTSSNELFLG